MDGLSKGLQAFLVGMGMNPDSVDHQTQHYVEHLLHLLNPEDEGSVISYFGLFGAERLSLYEIASARGLEPEDMMAAIDGCIRRLAVTPEWQMLRQGKV